MSVRKWLVGAALLVAIPLGVAVAANLISWALTHDADKQSPTPAPVANPASAPSPTLTPPPAVNTPAPAPVDQQPEQPATAPLDNQTITEARIEVVGSKISPTVYRAGAPPGYVTHVFTAAGEVGYGKGCYVHWDLYNNGTHLTTGDTSCNVAGGWSTAWWPNGTELSAGDVRVVASITTDWGASATTEVTFSVQ